jgi:transposase InsO family protein
MGFAEEEEAHLKKMLDAKVIEPSNSEWASAPVLVRKRDGKVRWCIDYRALNSVTVKDVFPLPLVEDCLDTLAGNIWFSKLDANSAYWQVRINEKDRKKTAFITKYGLFHFVKMAFGLCNAPATYARIMNLVLRGLTWDIVLAFLDDILVLGKSYSEHLTNLASVFSRFREYGLKLKPNKCELFQKKVEFLGRFVSESGVELGHKAIEVVLNWPRPNKCEEVQRFMGLVNYHRMFIKDFARLSVPLYKVTKKNTYVWGEEQEAAFQTLKQSLTRAPVLCFPNSKDMFILDTDASDFAIGAELLQLQMGEERVVAYGSFSLAPEQQRYCTTRKELLAVVRFTRQFRHYLLNKPFVIRTDHSSLTWLLRFKEPQGQIARWLEELSQYNMVIEHRAGKKHANADALSRLPETPACPEFRLGESVKGLPCGGCHYCQRAEANWGPFVREVDDVVALSGPKAAKVVTAVEQSPPAELSVWDFNNSRYELALFADNDLSILLNWIKTQQSPSQSEIFLASPAAKFYWINRDNVLYKGGCLWWQCPKTDELRLILPESMQKEAMKLNHDLPLAGHQGLERTKSKVKSRYFWYGMTRSLENYVSGCETCGRSKKPTRKARIDMTLYHAGAPMERVHLDFLGPLPKSSRGNEHVLVIVDQFTKWIECIPLPSQTAEVTAEAVVEFFSRFGCPLEIFTDRGANFESKLFQGVCQLLGIHKARTTPYRPSGNGQVERVNRTLMDAVRCFVGKRQNEWDRYLPQIAGALRSSVNRSTGFTANRLMLGRENRMPTDLVFPRQLGLEAESTEEFVGKLETSLKMAHEVARSTLRETQRIMKRDYDLKLNVTEFEEGNLVLVRDSASVKGKSNKLKPPWKGPAIIVKKLTPWLYRIATQRGESTINHDRLKKFKSEKVPAWIRNRGKQALTGDLPVSDSHKLYCICRQPHGGRFMIQCDGCDEWFHGSCVNLTEEEAKGMGDYFCHNCSED